ncbi:ABC transporter substrate-binding protein [Mesorhizobium sp. BR1-1-16]|uniref:ABC transporter substrate-binding protein n=1 Tax=Mesorhizobium sp. BR1-1-16 TaxID=2876653 RepID=UPI001CCB1260|nr:ABC transporter substrate-binding protein [Mesorhizobium sp. BR1-1-16]MBZ9937252.1 ABC transporter substrate-binding protein [Mesorhizobium sp. BR1-1-16]
MRKHVLAGGLAVAMAALATAPGQAQEPVTLTYLTSQGWSLDAHQALAEKFKQETGITIDTQIVPADQYASVLKAKLNSGEGPDIFGSQSGGTEFLNYNVEKNAVDLSGEAWAKLEDPLVAAQATVNGKLYGLTFWDSLGLVWVVNYSKPIFAKYGLTVPKTYEDLKGTCKTLLDNGIQPIFEPFSNGWHHVLWFAEVGPRYEQLQPGLAAELNANKATFAGNEAMRANLTQFKELYDLGCMGPNALSDSWADNTKMLGTGAAAMVVAPLAFPMAVKRDYPDFNPDDVGFFVMPLSDNQILNVNPAGPTMLIYKNSPHIAEAKKYFDFLTRPENIQFFLDNAPEALTMPFPNVKDKFSPAQKAFMEAYKDNRGTVYQTAVTYVVPQWMDMGKDITALVTEAMSPDDVLDSVDKRRSELAAAARDPAWK